MTVIPFRRPDDTKPTDTEEPLFYLTLYPSSTIVTSDDENPPDMDVLAGAVFDSAFHILSDADECIALISLGAARAMTYRQPNAFDTAYQRKWLRDHLDATYLNFTGRHFIGIEDDRGYFTVAEQRLGFEVAV